jgi:hypothetical protein
MVEQTKITVQVPRELLAKARQSTGKGITATVLQGLKLLAAQEAYRKLRNLKGKVQFSIRADQLREDR